VGVWHAGGGAFSKVRVYTHPTWLALRVAPHASSAVAGLSCKAIKMAGSNLLGTAIPIEREPPEPRPERHQAESII
jgi:hypothetical protein